VDLVVHEIAFVNTTTRPVRLTRVRVEAMADDATLASAGIPIADIISTTQDQVEMRQQGVAALADMSIPASTLGAGNHFVATRSTPAHGALLAQGIYLAVHGTPTVVRVDATITDAAGRTREVVTTLPAATPTYHNAYTMPLHGTWFARSIPGITSHHRWNAQTEFALDFWKLDTLGSPSRGTGDAPTDYYAYGQPVFAAADGEVVAVENTATQDYETRRHRPGESDDSYRQRIMQYNMHLMITDPHRGIIGNYVVIQHANGEYSAYGHLKTSSVTVTPGMQVTRGQQIAQVGDTGDSPLVHLHFQVCDGPDPLAARSIPFRFTDMASDDTELGTYVTSTGTH
jgi:murein DD-endopeptidase MepM/ murein hydrolase activator NlpD